MTDLTDNLCDYAFDLPAELVAQQPSLQRDEARLLLIRRNPDRGMPRFEDLLVRDLPAVVDAEASLKSVPWVRNCSRVFPARFYARRPTGGRHEIVLLEPQAQNKWTAIIRGVGDFKFPQSLKTDGPSGAELSFLCTAPGELCFDESQEPILDWLWKYGEMPLPPYIKNRSRARDLERYQSVWADRAQTGSAAAPTASLHFTDDLVQKLCAKGIRFADLVLHVGLGTFEPVRKERLSDHALHSERFYVSAESRSILNQGSALCVGTTAMRCLESLALAGHPAVAEATLETLSDGSLTGKTRIFVKPGVPIRYTKHLWTNFHLPESTLFVLVCCFAGSRKLALEAYQHAIAKKYRFFSYGDATLWI